MTPESLQPHTGLLRLSRRNEHQNTSQFSLPSDPYFVSVAASLVSSFLVVVLSVFALRQAARWISTKKFKSTRFLLYFYQDEDGSSTTQSIDHASKRKIHRISLPCVGIGLWLSVLHALFAIWGLETEQVVDWTQMAIWVSSFVFWY